MDNEQEIFELKVTVADFPQDNATDRGTLLELAERWPILAGLVYKKDGTVDDSVVSEFVSMDLTLGLAHYAVRIVWED